VTISRRCLSRRKGVVMFVTKIALRLTIIYVRSILVGMIMTQPIYVAFMPANKFRRKIREDPIEELFFRVQLRHERTTEGTYPSTN
jgi:hypothetical protein